jgi:hypothetical protein
MPARNPSRPNQRLAPALRRPTSGAPPQRSEPFTDLIARGGGGGVDVLPEIGVLPGFAEALLALATCSLQHVLTS